MRDCTRQMKLTAEADRCGISAETYAAAVECMAREIEVAKEFAVCLQKHFPGYGFEVRCEAERAAGYTCALTHPVTPTKNPPALNLFC